MTNPDPPHEVHDGKSPADGDIDSPDANAFVEQIADGDREQHKQKKGTGEYDHPEQRRASRENDSADFFRDRRVCVSRCDHWWLWRQSVRLFLRIGIESHYVSISGLGLRMRARYVVRGRAFNSTSKP